MNPASEIISRCGGTALVASWLGIDRSWVLRWTHPKSRGGTGGLVPSRHQAPLLARAKAEGVNLTPDMFFVVPSEGKAVA